MDVKTFLRTGSQAKAAFHAITALTQLPNVQIYTLTTQTNSRAQLYLETETEAFAIRWPSDINPFLEARDIELSTLNHETDTVQAAFNSLTTQNATAPWNVDRFEALLQGTKVIQIPQGTKQSWKDILAPHLPEGIQEVEICDRYIRNRYQFRSLELFLDALSLKASADGVRVTITTACEEGERDDVKAAFKKTQEAFASKGMKLTYKILEITDEMPHFRRIQIRSDGKMCSLWLDRGLDIFRFDNLRKPIFSTLETYIVVEQ
jgi:hypothetical protein